MGRMEKVYQFLRPLSIIFFLISFIWLSKAFLLGSYPDFKTQYYVPQIVFNGGDPYKGGFSLFTPQVYPPTEFLFFIPFSLVSLSVSSILYTAFSFISFYLSLYLLAKTFEIKFFSITNLFLMGFASLMFPAKFTLGMGQINMFVLLLLSLCLFSLKKNKLFVSGIWMGLSLVIKMFPPILLMYFLLKPNKKLLFGLAITILISGFFTIIFIPLDVIKSFFEVLPSLLNSWKLDYYNQAMSGFVGRSFGTGTLAQLIKNMLSLILVGSVIVVVIRNIKKDFFTIALIFGTLINLNVIVNTFSWQHHFVWLIIPLYATFVYLQKNKKGVGGFLFLGMSYILISLNLKTPEVFPLLLQSHVLFGSIILLLLNLHLLKRKF